MKRLTETDKWKDSWYIELSPYAKILLVYLYDNCDDAGFIDCVFKTWETQLKFETVRIKTALLELQKSLLSDKKKKLFIKDYLTHQKKFPLVKGNEEHDWIINKLKNNNKAPNFKYLLSNFNLN
jgi:hypothetical protein